MTLAGRDRVLILGNGIAGLTAADTLRDEGFDGEITIVGSEEHAAYSRPALSKSLLTTDELTGHVLPAPGHGAQERRGVRAVALDRDRRRVHLDDGDELGYDALVIATGSRARRLSAARNERTLRDLDDAMALRAVLAARPQVAVIGGSALGMEVASAAVTAGCEVTVYSKGLPLSGLLGDHLAGLVVSAARDRGLRVVAGTGAGVEVTDGIGRIVTPDAPPMDAELILSAVGDVPNVEWAAPSGLVSDGAIVVDRHGFAAERIAAVGDLARFPTDRGLRRLPLWTSAIEQAKVAAAALMRGTDSPPLAFTPYFWTDQFGFSIKAMGDLPLRGTPEVLDPGGDSVLPSGLWRWVDEEGRGTAVAVNHRIPLPRLRRAAALVSA